MSVESLVSSTTSSLEDCERKRIPRRIASHFVDVFHNVPNGHLGDLRHIFKTDPIDDLVPKEPPKYVPQKRVRTWGVTCTFSAISFMVGGAGRSPISAFFFLNLRHLHRMEMSTIRTEYRKDRTRGFISCAAKPRKHQQKFTHICSLASNMKHNQIIQATRARRNCERVVLARVPRSSLARVRRVLVPHIMEEEDEEQEDEQDKREKGQKEVEGRIAENQNNHIVNA